MVGKSVEKFVKRVFIHMVDVPMCIATEISTRYFRKISDLNQFCNNLCRKYTGRAEKPSGSGIDISAEE